MLLAWNQSLRNSYSLEFWHFFQLWKESSWFRLEMSDLESFYLFQLRRGKLRYWVLGADYPFIVDLLSFLSLLLHFHVIFRYDSRISLWRKNNWFLFHWKLYFSTFRFIMLDFFVLALHVITLMLFFILDFLRNESFRYHWLIFDFRKLALMF